MAQNEDQTVPLNGHSNGEDTNADNIEPVTRRPYTNVSIESIQPPAEAQKKGSSRWRHLFGRSNPSKDLPHYQNDKSDHDITVVVSKTSQSEIIDLETHWHPISEDAQRKLGRDWLPPAQLGELIRKGLTDWLVTVVLLVALWGEIYAFSLKAVMSSTQKNLHNFLTLALGLALGMAITMGLGNMALNMRWWFLSLKRRSPREVDLILSIDSLRDSAKLAWVSPRLAPICMAWILLNIAAQVAVAAVGLTLSVEDGKTVALTKPGNVTVPDMSIIYTGNFTGTDVPDDIDAQRFTAQSYGNVGLVYKQGAISNIPIPKTLYNTPADSYTIFSAYDTDRTTTDYWQFNFLDSNPGSVNPDTASGVKDGEAVPITVYTDRSINVTHSCNSWVISKGGSGDQLNITILLDGNGTTKNVTLPDFLGGLNQTTYWTDVLNDAGACGTGCTIVHAFESSETKPWYYQCNMTVGTVNNATLPEHAVSEEMRYLAGGAIAFQGYTFSQADNVSVQYQYYPSQSYYGAPVAGDANAMGLNIGNFAINVLASAALNNPSWTVQGDQPQKGSALSVTWVRLYLILGLIAGIQLVLMIVTSLVANLVFVKDASHLVVARTLRPLVERLGPAGNAADGRQIAEVLEEAGDARVVYSVRHPDRGSKHHLDLGVQKRLRAFPRGDYD